MGYSAGAVASGGARAKGGPWTPFAMHGSPLWSSWAEDPLWTPPIDGGEITDWRNAGSEGDWSNTSTVTAGVTYDADGVGGRPAISFAGVNNQNPQIGITFGATVAQPFTLLTAVEFTADNAGAIFNGDGNAKLRITSAGLSLRNGSAEEEGIAGFHSTGLVAVIWAVVNGANSALWANGQVSTQGGNMGTGVINGISMGCIGTSTEWNGLVGYSGGWSGDVSSEAWFQRLVRSLESWYRASGL